MILPVIKSFASKATEDLFNGISSREARKIQQEIQRRALAKLDYLHAAETLEALKYAPGNRLEPLKGDKKGKYSVRINQQYRIVFRFFEGNAYDVEIADYH